MKAPIAAFLLSLGLDLTALNKELFPFFAHSSEIELDMAKPLSPASANYIPIPDENTYATIASTRSRRMAEQRNRVREQIASGEFDAKFKTAGQFHRITEEQLHNLVDAALESDPNLESPANEWIRRGNLKQHLDDPRRNGERKLWGSSWGGRDPYATPSGMADTSQEYNMWAQGYRHVGDYIDCSNMFGGGGGSHDNGGDGGMNCRRWAAWCAYIDPYYAGGGYNEYHGDYASGKLDCHSPDTKWLLLGCYAQEHYQWYEQISKHLWAIDSFEYVTAVSGLHYMGEDNCQGPYYDDNGHEVYFGPMPLAGASLMMGAYSDDQCLYPHEYTTATYDSFFQSEGVNLGSKDQGQDDATYSQITTWWYQAQEYTMTYFNEVYSDYKYCTTCIDYPTYQDGYFIGDSGTDDDDLINQCWKFYSHDSYDLPADGLAQGAMQGGFTRVTMNGASFGEVFDGQYSSGYSSRSSSTAEKKAATAAQRMERLKANMYLTLAGIIFVATFLAFAVARGSSKKKKASSRSRSRRLLDADYGADSSSRHRSSSRAKSSRSTSRSNSKSRTSSSRSKSRSRRSEDGEYRAPSSSGERSRSKSRSRKTSSSSSGRK